MPKLIKVVWWSIGYSIWQNIYRKIEEAHRGSIPDIIFYEFFVIVF